MSKSPHSLDESSELATAIPVKRDILQKAKVEIMELPLAVVRQEVSEIPVEEMPLVAAGSVKTEESAHGREEEVEEMVSPVSPLPAEPVAKVIAEPRKQHAVSNSSNQVAREVVHSKSGASINRKALESTNRGKKPSSRRFVRGILHPSPYRVMIAAFFAILVRVVFLGVLALLVLLFLEQVETWTLWLTLILPVVALFHFATVGKARCRVCGLKEFVPSGAHKHRDSHRIPLVGPIFSTALHLLLFKWFRCMFCGTPIRIRK